MAREIIVTFNGPAAKIETKGFVGKACLDATAALKAELGETVSETMTPEFHRRSATVTETTQVKR